MIEVQVQPRNVSMRGFPKLMATNTNPLVVLFTGKTTGTVIRSEGINPIGFYATNWDFEKFYDFNDVLILENK